MQNEKERLDGDFYQMTEKEQLEFAEQIESSFWYYLNKEIPENYQMGD